MTYDYLWCKDANEILNCEDGIEKIEEVSDKIKDLGYLIILEDIKRLFELLDKLINAEVEADLCLEKLRNIFRAI